MTGRAMRRRAALAAAVGVAAGAAGCSPSGSTATPDAGPDPNPRAGSTATGSTAPPSVPATGRAPTSSPTRPASPASGPAGVPDSTGPAAATGPAVEIGHGPRTVPAVALTFHGSGDPDLARQLLDIVDRANATITVMAVGTWLAAQPGMAAAILHAGHELGNHTLHHLPMKSLTGPKVATEIAGCQQVLRRVTGSGQRWFRASGTQHTTPLIRAAAGRAGYQVCLSYDVDGLDWQDPPAATVVAAVLDHVQPGSIVSLHLGHRVTIRALPTILDGLRRRGLRPVSCSELLA